MESMMMNLTIQLILELILTSVPVKQDIIKYISERIWLDKLERGDMCSMRAECFACLDRIFEFEQATITSTEYVEFCSGARLDAMKRFLLDLRQGFSVLKISWTGYKFATQPPTFKCTSTVTIEESE
jgi:hypothetical protein